MKPFGPAGKIVALCLPPVLMALTGLALMQRRKGGAGAVARKDPGAVVAIRPKPTRSDRRG